MNSDLSILFHDVKSPVRASNCGTNWISLSFFKQMTNQIQLPGALGRE